MEIVKYGNFLLEPEDDNPELAPCPICGKKAFVMHSVVDGFDFGWDAGCPTAKLGDGVHGFEHGDELTEDFPRVSYRVSKNDAIKAWNKWVSRWTEKHKSAERKESVK